MLTPRLSHTRIRQPLLAFTFWLVTISCAFASDEAVVQKAALTATNTTVRVKASGEFSSGVMISATGKILTVNHGLPADVQTITVTDVEQHEYKATVVQRDPQRDLALLQISGSNFPTHYAVAHFTNQKEQQLVIASGYPAHDPNQTSALIRIGQITQHNKQLLRSTCQLTAGDSGGGLFNLNGQLVGINQRIGTSRSANVHCRIEKAFQTLSIGHPHDAVSAVETITIPPHHAHKTWSLRSLEVFDSSNPPTAATAEPLCHAVLWDSHSAFTKLSEIGNRQQVTIRRSGTTTPIIATVTLTDTATDLAILKFDKECPISNTHNPAKSRLHQLVVTGKEADQIAIIGRQKTTIKSTKPILGCTLSEVNGQIQIDSILPNSSAARANLQVSDRLVKIDTKPINGFDAIASQLQTLQPGDWSAFEVKRGTQTEICTVQLQHDAGTLLERTQHLDGAARATSFRRTGFQNVIQHDADMKPSDMGSPLLSLDGHLLGINIAVESREAIIAIPVETLQRLLQ